jgi:hypothetical protein
VANLGSFGTKREVVEDTFGWFEHELRVNPQFGELELTDFMEAAADIDDADTAKASAFLKDTFRLAVHPDDFEVFWATAKRERQTIQDLMGLFHAMIQLVSGRPTQRPSDSSDGPSLTSASSADDSSSQVIHRLEREGRPSIALMVAQRAESQASRASA